MNKFTNNSLKSMEFFICRPYTMFCSKGIIINKLRNELNKFRNEMNKLQVEMSKLQSEMNKLQMNWR